MDGRWLSWKLVTIVTCEPELRYRDHEESQLGNEYCERDLVLDKEASSIPVTVSQCYSVTVLQCCSVTVSQ